MKKIYFGLFTFCAIWLVASVTQAQNVKVFILAGQSNMEGHGEIYPDTVNGTLAHFINNNSSTEFEHLLNSDGSWASMTYGLDTIVLMERS